MRELKNEEFTSISGGADDPRLRLRGVKVTGTRISSGIDTFGIETFLNGFLEQSLSNFDEIDNILDAGGHPNDEECPNVTNNFDLFGGGEVEVTGCDSNRDGVVDGFEDLANDQRDINPDSPFQIRPGGPLDDLLDFINPQPFSEPDKPKEDNSPEPEAQEFPEDELTNMYFNRA